MPPKGARGAGRGRGRGRGKALAATAPDATTENEKTDTQSTDATISNDEVEAESAKAAASSSVPAIAAEAQAQEKVTPTPQSAVQSPNSSPATVPTETPAPTPTPARILPPARNYGVTIQPGAAVANGSGNIRGRGAARGTATAGPISRFKPKIGRRDQEERDELARKEELRLAGIQATYEKEQAMLRRGRGRGRGRGDAMGSIGRGRGSGNGSGIFGVAPDGLGKTPGFTPFRSSGSGGGGGYGIRSGPGGTSSGSTSHNAGGGSGGGGTGQGTKLQPWNIDPVYPGEEEDATERVNIEHINMQVPDDEVEWIGSRRFRKSDGKLIEEPKGLLPIRLHREMHRARGPHIKKEEKKEMKKEESEKSEVLSGKAKGKGKAVDHQMQDDDEISVKAEATDVNELAVIPSLRGRQTSATPFIKTLASVSPDSKRKARAAETATGSMTNKSSDTVMEDKPAISPVLSNSALQKSKKGLDPDQIDHLVLQTHEDIEENGRIQADMWALRDELGNLQKTKPKPIIKDPFADADGDTDMLEVQAPMVDKANKEGRLYLFQFPPVLPVLYDPMKEGKPKTKTQLARENANKDSGKEKGNAIDLTGTNTGKSKGKGKAIDLTSDIKIKDEEEIEVKDPEIKDEGPKKRDQYVTQEGHVGKMIVRKSGRVEFDWGGTPFLVNKGVQHQFLMTGMIVDSTERGPPGGGVPEGRAWSMGQIMGKFVVTPDFSKLMADQ